MANNYAATFTATSSGGYVNFLSTDVLGQHAVYVKLINDSATTEPVYVLPGSTTTATSSTGFPVKVNETFSLGLTCLDAVSRQAWPGIAYACETSSSGQSAACRLYVSAV